MNILDHYSKLLGSYLLEKKTSEEIIINLNDFISHYGTPSIVQWDNGLEFKNKQYKIFCEKKKLKLFILNLVIPKLMGL